MNRIMLVTGGSRGIGAATARLAAAKGYAVCISYISNEPAAQKVVADITQTGGNAIAVHADIGQEADIARLFEQVDTALGPLTALVNNAGMLQPQMRVRSLRGAFVGSEGMCGVATAICVRLMPNPPVVRTMLLDFPTVDDGAATVSDVIAAGIVPAALEMMDQLCLQAVEAWLHCGLPVHSAAALLVEVVGEPHAVDAHTDTIVAIARQRSVRDVRIAADEAERALLWKGRKSAFGAIARIKPNYYLHDTVVPRRELPAVLKQVYEIAARHGIEVLNVFHAGDGNLHPLLLFDAREPGVMDRVLAAGAEIVSVSVAAGGVLSGEHGIGLEKRDMMPLMFGPADLEAQAALRDAFDPAGLSNPGKVLPSPARCADIQSVPAGAWI